MDTPPKEGLVFPCDYGIKVIGRDVEGFEAFVRETLESHLPAVDRGEISARPSRQGAYLCVSVRFLARSREQMDALSSELGADPRVKYVF